MKKVLVVLSVALLTIASTVPARATGLTPVEVLQQVEVTPADLSGLDLAYARDLAAKVVLADDPTSVLESLTHSEIVAVKAYLQPSTYALDSAPAVTKVSRAYPTGCWSQAQTYRAFNAFGFELWNVSLKSSFCAAAGLLKSVTYQGMYPSIYSVGWTAEGVLSSGTVKGSRSGLVYGQYKMNYQIAGWVLQSDVPCMRNLVSGDGSWSFDSVCGP